MAGVTPQLPTQQDKEPFKNICPQCRYTKATQRPASSSGRPSLMSKRTDFMIKKGTQPAGLIAIKQRKIFEQEQQDFISDIKQFQALNKQAVVISSNNIPQNGPIKVAPLKKKFTNVELSPIKLSREFYKKE